MGRRPTLLFALIGATGDVAGKRRPRFLRFFPPALTHLCRTFPVYLDKGMAADSERPPGGSIYDEEQSAHGESLGRRRFLGGFLGLGTGAAVFGPVPPSPSPGREEADLSPARPRSR